MFIFLAIFLFSTTTPLLAADMQTIVVTANRMQSDSATVASSFSVISEEEISHSGSASVKELLSRTQGLSVQNNGGPGQTSSVLIRGAKSEHTLVLIDGVIMNDPLTPSRSFDFSHLSTDNIERIEVLRGSQSVLYGSDAIGGVIQIFTKKNKTKKSSAFASSEYGAMDSWHHTLGTQGTMGPVGYSLESSWEKSAGISAAGAQYGNKEKDAYQKFTLAPSLHARLRENAALDWQLRYVNAKVDTDTSGGPGGDKLGTAARTQQLFTRLQSQTLSQSGNWESIVGMNYSQHHRLDNTSGDSFFRSNLVKTDWQNNFTLSEHSTLSAGLEAAEESGIASDIPAKKTADTYSFFTQWQEQHKNTFGTLGARIDFHSLYGNSFTYRLAPGYWIAPEQTKLKASYSTGFKAPSLYQLYSSYGSTALYAEKSLSYELGFEQKLHQLLQWSETYFQNNFNNLIDFNSSTNKYINRSRTESFGLESSLQSPFTVNWGMELSHILLRARDRSNGAYLTRRPHDTWNLKINYSTEKNSFGFNYQIIGKRNDVDPITFATKEMPVYHLAHLDAGRSFNSHWKVFSRIENLFNHKYEEVAGYGTPGFSLYAGVRASL